jgi:hypothetical protein
LSEFLIKTWLRRDNWRFDVKNRCASDETDSLVSYARKKAAKREVQENEVERTIARPDFIVPGQWRRRIFMRRYFDQILETEMLLRVVAEETDTELTVVTLYKTSKFAKYEGGA